jgi:hypothetical protein
MDGWTEQLAAVLSSLLGQAFGVHREEKEKLPEAGCDKRREME